MHRATRIALKAPYRPNQNGYITFEQRISTLNILTLSQRRTIASIVAIMKIVKGITETCLSQSIQQCVRSNYRTRAHRIFNISATTVFPQKSPIHIAMHNVNTHHNVFNVDNSISTIKSKLKEYSKS